MRVNGARNAVFHLQVKLGDGVAVVHAGFTDITLGGGINHVANQESLHGLILRARTTTVAATNELDVTTSLTVFTSITAFLRHLEIFEIREWNEMVLTSIVDSNMRRGRCPTAAQCERIYRTSAPELILGSAHILETAT